jgi:mRNA-degrading endonuclease YafQ of YafQ-DinJ toxin-antitoxin module
VNRELIRSSAFIRAARRHLKKNPRAVRTLGATLLLLAEDAFDPRLKTHKLKGDLDGIWACSAGYDLRILFELVQHDGAEAVLLLTMGPKPSCCSQWARMTRFIEQRYDRVADPTCY